MFKNNVCIGYGWFGVVLFEVDWFWVCFCVVWFDVKGFGVIDLSDGVVFGIYGFDVDCWY